MTPTAHMMGHSHSHHSHEHDAKKVGEGASTEMVKVGKLRVRICAWWKGG